MHTASSAPSSVTRHGIGDELLIKKSSWQKSRSANRMTSWHSLVRGPACASFVRGLVSVRNLHPRCGRRREDIAEPDSARFARRLRDHEPPGTEAIGVGSLLVLQRMPRRPVIEYRRAFDF